VAGLIVVDAGVLIAHLDENDALHDRAVEALLATAERPLGCSPITLAEVLVAPARAGRLRDARGAVTDLGVLEIALGDDAAARLAGLRAETVLNMPDCCVLLAAEDAPAEAVLTFDDRLARAAEQRRLPVL
jgi:predicted nucleic acid-binding protein